MGWLVSLLSTAEIKVLISVLCTCNTILVVFEHRCLGCYIFWSTCGINNFFVYSFNLYSILP